MRRRQPTLAPLAPLFDALFPHARDGAASDRQARAAALALLRSLLLVTGGPGTGKTTTITRLLLLLIAQARQAGRAPPRIALAAPTGRAAERMAESLRQRDRGGCARCRGRRSGVVRRPAGRRAARCTACSARFPDSPRFRFGAEHPLPFDVVVVDEASMVDLPLMCKLVEAVADGARLVLLGDRDQLPSVEAGDVLAAIVDATADDGRQSRASAGDRACAEGLSEADATRLAPLLGDVPRRCHRRQRAHRWPVTACTCSVATASPRRSISRRWPTPCATATPRRALALLRDGTLDGVNFHEDLRRPARRQRHARRCWRLGARSAQAREPAEALGARQPRCVC